MNETIQAATLIRDMEQVLAEWATTQADQPIAAAAVRGMSSEIRSVLYAHFVDQPA